ncbi:MAG: metal ABC transporter solute-binding protein, Zn/Mn family [Acidimicrobiales bacterium]
MRRALVMAVVAAGFVAASCGGAAGPGARTEGGRLRVVAGFYPLAEAARRVGGDAVEVTNLTPAGSEPHDLELSSREVDRIEDAAVVLYLGAGFQPAVEGAVKRAKGAAVDLLRADLGLLDGDPHVWLDPTLQRRMVVHVQVALAAADPVNAAAYQANAAAYGAELDGLHREYSGGLADCDRRVIVTSHAAFGYLARRYDLVQEPISGLSPEAEPEPRRLAELSDKVRRDGITTVFYETLVSPAVAEALAREAGVGSAVLDPLEGLSEDGRAAGDSYVSVMRRNLNAIRAALGCR